MKKRIFVAIAFTLFAISLMSSCKGQDCPAYDEFKGKPAASASISF